MPPQKPPSPKKVLRSESTNPGPQATNSSATTAKSPLFWGIFAVVAVAQLAWLFWILGDPLPNASNNGGQLTRGMMLWRFLPEVVPGITYSESFLANLVEQLSHVENLPQRLPIVLAGSLIWLSAIAIGRLVLRISGLWSGFETAERLGLAFGLGMSMLAWITLILGRLGMVHPWTARIGLLVPLVAEGYAIWSRRRRTIEVKIDMEPALAPPRWPTPSLLLAAAPFVLIMTLASMLPTIDFDAIEYHVQGPKEYFQAGKISFLPHNVYTSMPFSIEMLHLLGMEVTNDWWWGALVGQLMVASFAPMAGLMIWLTARRWGSPRAAWIATLAYLSTPWIYRLAAIPYVEGPLCYYHAALIWAVGRAWSSTAESKTRAWWLIGLLAGGAMAIKYPALISAVLPFGVVSLVAAWQAKNPRLVLAYCLGVGLVMAPWLIKNVIDTGNPVYPLGYKVFGGRNWDAFQDAKWANAHGPRPIETKAFFLSILDVAGRSDWQSPAYAALVPLAFLVAARRRPVLLIFGFAAYLFLTWWIFTHRLDRFWLPLLPCLAILAGIGADWSSRRSWSALLGFILGTAVLANLIYCSTTLAGLEDWTGDLKTLRTKIPRILNAPLVAMDTSLPPDAKPLLVGQAAVFHLNRPVIYNTVFNKETIEELSRDRSTAEFKESLRKLGVTHVYVDWHEIERYRSPGNYGFTDYVTPQRFRDWVGAGILLPPEIVGSNQELYRVRGNN